MKHIKTALLFIILLYLPLHGNIRPSFGVKSDFNYTDLKNSPTAPDYIFNNDTSFYIGFEYLTLNFYTSITPALRIYTTNNFSVEIQNGNFIKRNEEIAKITFAFDDIYFSYIGNNLSFYFGKRIFHFGEGFNRQYLFVGSSVLNDDFNALYNAEVNIYQDNITYSIGFMPDTDSIDLLENPEYYLSWYSVKYSTPSLGLLGIVDYTYNVEDKNNNLKLGFEASYIFNTGIKLYGSIIYNLIDADEIGKTTDDVNSLIGVNYTFIYDDIIINPYLEYFYEESSSFYSLGFYASFFDSLFSITSSYSYASNNKMSLIVIAGLNINDKFNLDFTYNTPLKTDEQLEQIFELGIEYNY